MTDDGRLGPPPIEPLSDVAWSRVERGVWAQLDAEAPTRSTPPGPRRWWLVAAPLAAAAAIAVIVLATRGRPIQLADEPSRVVTGTAPSRVTFGDSHIELEAATALVMTHEDEHPTVLLERGAARFTVAPRQRRPAFVVRAGDATVRVVGTQFRVGRSEERIAVDVDRGVVDVLFRGSVMPVGAGQHWSSDAPGHVAAVTASAEPVAPAPQPEATPPEPPQPAPEVASPTRRHEPRPARPAASTARTEPKLETAHAATDGDATDGDPGRAEYDRLAALEPRSPEAAMAGYLALARGTSRWASLALYAAARLANDRHDSHRAETLLGIYLQRFPGGANAADARKLLDRLESDAP